MQSFGVETILSYTKSTANKIVTIPISKVESSSAKLKNTMIIPIGALHITLQNLDTICKFGGSSFLSASPIMHMHNKETHIVPVKKNERAYILGSSSDLFSRTCSVTCFDKLVISNSVKSPPASAPRTKLATNGM